MSLKRCFLSAAVSSMFSLHRWKDFRIQKHLPIHMRKFLPNLMTLGPCAYSRDVYMIGM